MSAFLSELHWCFVAPVSPHRTSPTVRARMTVSQAKVQWQTWENARGRFCWHKRTQCSGWSVCLKVWLLSHRPNQKGENEPIIWLNYINWYAPCQMKEWRSHSSIVQQGPSSRKCFHTRSQTAPYHNPIFLNRVITPRHTLRQGPLAALCAALGQPPCCWIQHWRDMMAHY